MLNLSDNRIEPDKYIPHFESLRSVEYGFKPLRKIRTVVIALIIFIVLLFLPWTQSVRAPGNLTTLYPDQRPQTVQNVIPGKIEKWFVREGQLVQRGDTIIQMSEVKDAYFDPKLIERTGDQISSKKNAADNYMQKAGALADQISALAKSRVNKAEQAENKAIQAQLKLISDSIDYEASKLDYSIANQRLERMEELYKQGLKSLTDLESRRLKVQESKAKQISAENKLLSARNELLNAKIELNSIDNYYAEMLGKAKSDRNSALSTFYDTEAEISKMEGQRSNYQVRRDNYYVTATQAGFITRTLSVGLGETIKEGTEIVSIMPVEYDLAVELYIDPVDLPLMKIEDEANIIFDGWPAIVFSGWPQLSNGTFGGEVWAIDNFISTNGKYRIILVPEKDEGGWPADLRVGSGADGIMLLRDVPLWYELWRQLNGFPPDYYTVFGEDNGNSEKK